MDDVTEEESECTFCDNTIIEFCQKSTGPNFFSLRVFMIVAADGPRIIN